MQGFLSGLFGYTKNYWKLQTTKEAIDEKEAKDIRRIALFGSITIDGQQGLHF
jgi:hypothetical protein